jgi:hypothetical protein
MRTIAFLAFLAMLSSQASDAREIRRDGLPESFWGTWAPSADACKDADKSSIVLAAKSYAGPAGNCVVNFVDEVPGPVYSARMSCATSQPPGKTFTNLIIRPGTAEQISLGSTFDSLVAHRRCPAGEQTKQP